MLICDKIFKLIRFTFNIYLSFSIYNLCSKFDKNADRVEFICKDKAKAIS
jgi:hypothetical protein